MDTGTWSGELFAKELMGVLLLVVEMGLPKLDGVSLRAGRSNLRLVLASLAQEGHCHVMPSLG